MTVQWSVAVRNSLLDAWEVAIGTSARIEIRTGAQPDAADSAASGKLLAFFPLSFNWAADAVDGTKHLNNLPVSTLAISKGLAGHYRITDSTGTTCHEQGSITRANGGGDLRLDNVVIATAQPIQLVAWSKSAPGV